MNIRHAMFAALLMTFSLLVACGGGGDGGGGGISNLVSNPAGTAASTSGATVRGQISGDGVLSGIAILLVGVDGYVAPAANIIAPSVNANNAIYFGVTDASGAFSISNVAPGNYNLIARKDRNTTGIQHDIKVAADVSMPIDVALRLVATGDISGTVQVPTGYPTKSGILAFVPGTSFSAFTDDNGNFVLSGVPVGTYTIAFNVSGLAQGRLDRIAVGPGQITSLPVVALASDTVSVAGWVWKGELATAPANPQDNWAYYNTSDGKSYLAHGGSWHVMAISDVSNLTGPQGLPGVGITWKGSLSAAPTAPQVNWAYYDTTQKKSLIWDGSAWQILSQDGLVGAQGPVGPQGPAGIGIVWKGSSASAPANPQLNWAYYNTTDKKAYIYDGSAWQVMAQDGVTGAQGLPGVGITWKGALAAAPLSPQLNWAYYNTVAGISYIYDGTTWQILAKDGNVGAQGPQGPNGVGIIWKGTLAAAPGSPQLNWAYYNSTDKRSYLWDGSTWQTLSQDGATGPQGPAGSSVVWKGMLSSAPTSPQLNWAYFDTTLGKTLLWSGSAWIDYNSQTDFRTPSISGIDSIPFLTKVRVVWHTDEPASASVRYGTSPGVYTNSVSSYDYLLDHNLTISGLSTGTTYYLEIVSSDQSGNTATSTEQIVVTDTTVDIQSNGGSNGAMLVGHRLYTWGAMGPMLGDGTGSMREKPVCIMKNVKAFSLMGHGILVKMDGTVWSWGPNSLGQLGDGTTTTRWQPVQVPGLSNIVGVSAGGGCSYALTAGGSVYAWGWNASGQLGDGTTNSTLVPQIVPGLPATIVKMAAGSGHILVLTSGGGIKAWGANGAGQLGNGVNTNSLSPVDVIGLTSGVTDICAGISHSMALTSTGAVKTWGYNGAGQLGDGTLTDRYSPLTVPGLGSGMQAISAGESVSLALTTSGCVKSWGQGPTGALGNGTNGQRLSPGDVLMLTSGVTKIFAAQNQNGFALLGTAVWAWGKNDSWVAGDWTNGTSVLTPIVFGDSL